MNGFLTRLALAVVLSVGLLMAAIPPTYPAPPQQHRPYRDATGTEVIEQAVLRDKAGLR